MNEIAIANERVAESCESTECQSADSGYGDEMMKMQNLSESIMNYKKFDDNPELKPIVMEIIFGSTNSSAIEDQANQ